MKKINFTNATVTAQASVEIDGVSHDVTSAVIEGGTLPTPDNINQLQNNVEEAILNPVVESIKSKNLINEIITGYTLTGTGGIKVEATQFVTGFMEVEGGKTYTSQGFKGANGVENNYKDWYTADKTFISNTNDKTATAPANAKFCRMNGVISTSSNMQLEEGNTATSYTPLKRYGYNSQESMGSIVVDDINCKNLFNKNNVLIGVFINLSGVQTASENMCMTNYYIEVNPNTEYTFSSNVANYLYIAEYNSSKEFIKSTGIDATDKEITITTDIGTKYVIASCSKHYLDGMQFEEGSTATNYSEYKGIGYTSGSNENGSWVKYDDGRMECTKTLSTYADATNQWGSMYETVEAVPLGNTPQNFVGDLPKVIVTIHDNDWFIESVREVQLNSFGNMRLALPISATNRKLVADIVAYGRWK